MAHALKSQIASYKTDTSDFPSPSPYDHLGPATVVIVDRSIDLIAPLLHTLAFQALAHDTFEIRKEINAKNIQHLMWKDERGDQKAPDAILDESSSVFNTLRHLFISLAWEEVNTAAKSIQQFTHRGKTSIEDLRFKVFQMQDVHAQKEQVSAISSLLEEIKAKMEQRSWREVAQVEQGIALGKGTDGAVLTRKKAIAAVADLLSKEDLDIEDKRRLLLILTLAIGGTSQDDFTSLWRAAMMDDTDHVMFRGIQFFSVDPEAARELMKNSTSWSIKSIFKMNAGSGGAEEDDYLQVYDGYQPRIARILQDQMDGRLDPREFRTVKGGQAEAEEASRRKKVGTIRRKLTDHGKIGPGVLVDFSHKDSDNKPMFVPKWGRARPRADGDLGGDYRGNGARTILVVVGGLSYAEVRAAYLTSMKNKREVYVGETSF
ncbi:Sec1-like protein, partial [Chytriomyces sp. MP71]